MYSSFVLRCADLFDGVFRAIMSTPVLKLFMTSALFFALVSLLFWLATWGRKKKL